MKPVDYLLIILAGTVIIYSYWHFWSDSENNQIATIQSLDQKLLVSTLQDQLIEIKGPIGKSQVQVKKGKIRFLSSPCPHQYCVKAGWLTKQGDVATCLPNRISIKVGSNSQFDTINF